MVLKVAQKQIYNFNEVIKGEVACFSFNYCVLLSFYESQTERRRQKRKSKQTFNLAKLSNPGIGTMEETIETSIPEPELALMYQNITEVVNLKCFQCHEKLKVFLKSLLKTQCCKKVKKSKNIYLEPSVTIDKTKEFVDEQLENTPDQNPQVVTPDPGPTQDLNSPVLYDAKEGPSTPTSKSAKPTLDDCKEFLAQNSSMEVEQNKRTLLMFNKVKSDCIGNVQL